MKLIPVLLLLPALLFAGKKDSTNAVKYGNTVLSIDSAATKQVAMQVFRDTTGMNYVVIKILPDGTLQLSNGLRSARITNGELTQSYLDALFAESEAMAIELIAARQRAKARKEHR